MAEDTEVLLAEPALTLDPRRCVFEVSLRFLGIIMVRARFPVATGELAVSDAAGTPVGALRLELLAIPTRASLPLANRLLRMAIPGGCRLVITLPTIELSVASAAMHADGAVSATSPASSVGWPLCCVVRSIQPSESDVILLAVRGRLRSPREQQKTAPLLSFLRPWIRVETAAEFTR